MFVESFLRKKEDDIRIFMQELAQQHYNEDDVIAELQSTINDIARSRLAIPQVVELQRLSFLNRDAEERGKGVLAFHHDGGMYRNHVSPQFNYSPNSSPDEESTLV